MINSISTVGLIALLCVLPSAGAEEQDTKPAQAIRVEAALRTRSVVDLLGKENPCVHAESSQSSCLVIKVSGIETNALVKIWMNETTTGGVYVAAGQAKYRISSILGQTESRYTVLELTVPKDIIQFGLVVDHNPLVNFAAAATVAPKVSDEELFREPKK
jgi:uncharacterized RmlC-like cupin family protein